MQHEHKYPWHDGFLCDDKHDAHATKDGLKEHEEYGDI